MSRQKKINPKDLKAAAQRKGIRSISALAPLVPCSRPAIYFALENPTRFPRVFRRILELTT